MRLTCGGKAQQLWALVAPHRHVAQGEEVINCYGRLPPGELLRRFGISESGSLHECCEARARTRARVITHAMFTL